MVYLPYDGQGWFHGLERQKMREIFRWFHCTENHAPGKSREENRPVHDSQNPYGSGRNRLLQDTALKSDF